MSIHKTWRYLGNREMDRKPTIDNNTICTDSPRNYVECVGCRYFQTAEDDRPPDSPAECYSPGEEGPSWTCSVTRS